ncbi:MAG: ATP-binding protein [Solirubrobacterales bacterium]
MAGEIVNRKHELKRLREAFRNPPQLVVLRGRRRVGKSYLLVHALRNARGVFFQADEQPAHTQLDLFADEVARLTSPRVPLHFDSWDQALDTLAALAAEKPLAVVLDEFQWLLAAEPALDSILQRHWDRWQREGTPLTMVLSGSALRLMEGLLEPGAPLYGRADYRPLLGPLDYRDAGELGPARAGTEQRLRRYAVLGGTPQYQVWAGRRGLSETIAERILTKGESLYEEPLHLLREEQEIRDPATYFAVVLAIAQGRTRVADISNATGLPTPNLTKMLARLESLGYIEARAPLSPTGPERKRSSYRLVDPFFRFWFRFVFGNRSLLERGRVKEVLAIVERDLDTYMGLAFEDCCREWIGRYADAERFGALQQIGGWWSRDGRVEIDIVGASRGRYELLGSCKWDRSAGTDVLGQLLAHRDQLPGAAAARLAIFARGFDSRLRRRAAEEDVILVGADELFESG